MKTRILNSASIYDVLFVSACKYNHQFEYNVFYNPVAKKLNLSLA